MSRLPLIGRLTPWEFLSGAALLFCALLGAGLLFWAYTLLNDPRGQGSGGGALFVLFMFLGVPVILLGCGVLVTCAVSAVLLTRRIRARLRGAPAKPARHPRRVLQLTQALTWTALALVAMVIVPALLSDQSREMNDVGTLDAAQMVALGIYLALVGLLAAQLDKPWPVWLLAILLTFPFGPVVAYFVLRLEAEQALGASRSP